jgi:hypothetical protein
MTFDQVERALLGRLADQLIPSGDGLPAASVAGVAGPWLDAVLAARPDMAAGLKTLLLKARDYEPAAFVNHLQKNDPAAFGILGEVAAAAYFMNPDVQTAIGYSGQSPRPIDEHPDYLDGGLLEAVIRRGPIYRRTPSPVPFSTSTK